MQCLRCGREIAMGDVFCRDCLENMANHPIKPGTPVLIPKRQEAAVPKKQVSRRPAVPPEVQVKRLKRRLRLVTALLALVLAVGCAAAWAGYAYIVELRSEPLPGQNYSSVTVTAPTGITEP